MDVIMTIALATGEANYVSNRQIHTQVMAHLEIHDQVKSVAHLTVFDVLLCHFDDLLQPVVKCTIVHLSQVLNQHPHNISQYRQFSTSGYLHVSHLQRVEMNILIEMG